MKNKLFLFLTLVITCTMMISSSSATTFDAALELLEDNYKNVRRFVLDNGTICLVQEDHSAPVASVQIWAGSGSIHEDEHLGAGLSHAVEHMVFKGTPTRPVGKISRDIDNIGGDINAYTTLDRTVFYVTVPATHWETGVDVLSDAVMNATFPEDEWTKEKEVIVREMAMGKDDPNRIMWKLLARNMYRVHPHKYPVIGYEEVFRQVSRDDLANYFHRRYTSDNLIVVVSGDVKGGDVEAKLREVNKDFSRRSRAPLTWPKEPEQGSPRFAHETGPYEVSRLEWGHHTVGLSHPDTPALDVLAAVVGQGRSSALVKSLKEEQQLVVSIDASSYTPKEPGLFAISATFAPDKEASVIDGITKEIKRWKTKSFPKSELEKAKRRILVSELNDLQTAKGLAQAVASGEFFAGDPAFSVTYLKRINNVTPEDLQRVAKKYLKHESRTIVTLTPEVNADAAEEISTTPVQSQPKMTKFELLNGLPVIVREDHRLPFVAICSAIGGGLLSETESNNGISQLTADLLTRGTPNSTSAEIALTIESMGASLAGFAGRNSSGLKGQCLSSDLEAFATIFSECLVNPSFPKDELSKQKKIQLTAIQQHKENPVSLAYESLRQEVFGSHPYRFNVTGTEEAVNKITRAELINHYKKHAVSGNMALTIFGDITAERAKALLEDKLAHLTDSPKPTYDTVAINSQLPSSVTRREPKEQSVLFMGFPTVPISNPKRDGLAIIDNALGGLSSTLSAEVREKRGLVYYIYATQLLGLDTGMIGIYAGTREDAVAEVEALVDAELQRLILDGLTDEELTRSREQLIARRNEQMQSNLSFAQTCALDELYGLGYDHSLQLRERLESFSMEDLKNIAREIFDPQKRALSLLLPEQLQQAEIETE